MTSDLAEHVKEFNGKQVLVVGDVGLDRYTHGISTRLCPEAPVPVFTPRSEVLRPGLAGNVAANVAAMGGTVKLCSICGDDQSGFELLQCLDEAKVSRSERYIGKDPSRKTTVKNRFYIDKHMLLRVDDEQTDPFDESIMKKFTADVCNEIVEWAQSVVIQDYGKGLITRPLIEEMLKACAEKRVKIVVDPSPKQDPKIYSGCHFIKPNLSEAQEMMRRMNLFNEFSLQEHLGCDTLVVTQGANGIRMYREFEEWSFPVLRKEVFDVCGAGDTVTATIALGIASGFDIVDSVQIANAAASIVVGKFGTATVNLDELGAILQED